MFAAYQTMTARLEVTPAIMKPKIIKTNKGQTKGATEGYPLNPLERIAMRLRYTKSPSITITVTT